MTEGILLIIAASVVLVAEIVGAVARRRYVRAMRELDASSERRHREFIAASARNTDVLSGIASGLSLPNHRGKDTRAS